VRRGRQWRGHLAEGPLTWVRVVLECDGIQRYADEARRPDPRRYAEMVAEDRELRLRGYAVYRFGGQKLTDGAHSEKLLTTFFDARAARHAL
jgi:very-short-patch-repair endonuclease